MRRRRLLQAAAAAALAGTATACTRLQRREDSMIVATYNVALHGQQAGDLARRLRAGDAQAAAVAQVLRQLQPDIVLLNEFDHDPTGEALGLFLQHYLASPDLAGAPLHYPWHFLSSVNTGEPSGLDLDGDGRSEGPQDCWGYGLYPGQYGMLLLSRHPIDGAAARSFRLLRWSTMPRARRPQWPDGRPYHADPIWQQLRLSSKNHWDVPVQTPLGRLHLLASHPTPPAFDGPENRNGNRNHDEIRFWSDYLSPVASDWIIDDDGRPGGLPGDVPFIILGDLNADPADGDSGEAIRELLAHPRVRDPAPRSRAGRIAAARAGGANLRQRGDAALDTGVFDAEAGPGHLRVDYVLPARELPLGGSAVHWPIDDEPGAEWVSASDHRPVWLSLRTPVGPG